MGDYLLKALAYNDEVRIHLIDGLNMVSEGITYQRTTGIVSKLFGESLLGTCLLGSSLLKNKQDKLTVRINTEGALGYLIIDTNVVGEVKGYVQRPVLDQDLMMDEQILLGERGMLSISKDMGLKTPFGGQIPLFTVDFSEAFSYYLTVSEQIPSAVALAVDISSSGTVSRSRGIMIQALPNASEGTIAKLENQIRNLKELTDCLDDHHSARDILERVADAGQLRLLEETSVGFYCDCSRERFWKAMITLGAKEIQTIIQKDGQAEVECHFCHKKYLFSKSDLEKMLT